MFGWRPGRVQWEEDRDQERMELSWSSSAPPPSYRQREEGEEGVTIVLRCPRVSSLELWLAVYLCVTVITSTPLTSPACCVQAGIGISLSSLWVIGHIYVLCHTSEYSLREQRLGRKEASDWPTESFSGLRYVDVAVGISLLISQSCLIIGARNNRIHHVLVFLIFSVLVIGAYWAWWAGLYYHKSETEASKEVTEPDLNPRSFLVDIIILKMIFFSCSTLCQC